MKNILLKFGVFATFALMLASCSEDYLNTEPTDAIATSSAFATTKNAWATLNGIHRSLYMQWSARGGSSMDQCGESSLMISRDMLGEDLVMTAAGNGWYNNTYKWVDHRNENSRLTYFAWYVYYRIIGNANMIIANIDKAEGPEADKKAIKGQAYTYRAWAHFNLVQLYGKRYNAATAATDKGVPIMTTNDFDGKPRSSVAEVYAQINKDLDSAMVNLQGYVRPNKSHLNLNVAHGIKARVALTMGNWAEAETYARAARQGFTLMDQTQYTSGFNDYTNPEWMWGSMVIPDQTTYFWSFFAFMSWNFSSTNIRTNPKAIYAPLYNQIPATDIRKTLWEPNPTAANFPLPHSGVRKPYMTRKFTAAGSSDSRGDIPYMRAAEMYLIEAEAIARQGGRDAQAAEVLRQMVVTRDPAYTLSSNTGQALIDEIMFQRRIELWGEGFRFLDLKRTNSPLVRDLAGSNHNPALATLMNEPAGTDKWQFLIPIDEINANPQLKNDQNP